jgi:hypothetical protein
MTPEWAMVVVVLSGQLVSAVWIIASLRGRVIRAEEWASQAYQRAGLAHQRIDKVLQPQPKGATDGQA